MTVFCLKISWGGLAGKAAGSICNFCPHVSLKTVFPTYKLKQAYKFI